MIKAEYVNNTAVNTVYLPDYDDHAIIDNQYLSYSVTENTMPLSNGYVTAFQFVNGILVTSALGGNSNTYYCDFY